MDKSIKSLQSNKLQLNKTYICKIANILHDTIDDSKLKQYNIIRTGYIY